jgi:phosphoadenosine phosphosulfate reductase
MKTTASSRPVSSPPVIPDLEKMTAAERVRWADEVFGDDWVLSTSFGIQSAVMLHLVTQVKPTVPVIFIDTGYLFPETYRFAEALTERLQLNLKVYQPAMTAARQEALFGRRWEQDEAALDAYNLLNKVEPMNRAVTELGARAWLTGLRRAQSSTRESRTFAEQQNRIMKVYPILDWTDREIYHYLKAHDLPYHPFWDMGYVSVGDWHSTSKLEEGMRPEDTRFNGVKRECGLHLTSDRVDFQI